VYVPEGETYTDPGATATDASGIADIEQELVHVEYDGDLVILIYGYTAVDTMGNRSETVYRAVMGGRNQYDRFDPVDDCDVLTDDKGCEPNQVYINRDFPYELTSDRHR
jgi:hypothetical protein